MTVVVGKNAEKFVKGIVFPKSWQGRPSFVTKTLSRLFGFPQVLKLIHPSIVHKTEKHVVRVVHTFEEVVNVLTDFEKSAKHDKLGTYDVLLQEFVKGVELIAGLKRDDTFGGVIMIGLGGVFAEVFHDVSFRVCPITPTDAFAMIDDLECKLLLKGVRGMPKAKISSLVNVLVSISKVAVKNSQLKELDINPLIITSSAAVAVDIRVVL